jgi:hypothetical protein
MQFLLGLASAIFLGSLSPVDLMAIFYFINFDTLLMWRVSFLYLSPEEQDGPVIPSGIGFLSHCLLYDVYGGGILTRLHRGNPVK